MADQLTEKDIVTEIIKACHSGKETAETIYKSIADEKKRTLNLSGVDVIITDEEAGEFVQRFSAEVEPTLWESKRRKQ